jgi:hypothetical protein
MGGLSALVARIIRLDKGGQAAHGTLSVTRRLPGCLKITGNQQETAGKPAR